MKVSEHRQTVLANNIANAETAGFKHDLAIVMQRRVESRGGPNGLTYAHPVLDELSGGVNVRPTHYSTAPGPIHGTGRPLDVAIEGEGFFAVGSEGITRYTRDGTFTTNLEGELVLSAGGGRWNVLDEGGDPIVLLPEAGPPKIGADGTIRQDGEVVARLQVVKPDRPQGMRKVGENLFEAKAATVQPIPAKLTPESLEASNFEIMPGLAQMIEASRLYEMNATLVQLQDEATGQAITRVGRLA
jgi:flagellar basal body rod protein FlgG